MARHRISRWSLHQFPSCVSMSRRTSMGVQLACIRGLRAFYVEVRNVCELVGPRWQQTKKNITIVLFVLISESCLFMLSNYNPRSPTFRGFSVFIFNFGVSIFHYSLLGIPKSNYVGPFFTNIAEDFANFTPRSPTFRGFRVFIFHCRGFQLFHFSIQAIPTSNCFGPFFLHLAQDFANFPPRSPTVRGFSCLEFSKHSRHLSALLLQRTALAWVDKTRSCLHWQTEIRGRVAGAGHRWRAPQPIGHTAHGWDWTPSEHRSSAMLEETWLKACGGEGRSRQGGERAGGVHEVIYR